MDYFDELHSTDSQYLRNELLFEFLGDDRQRPALYTNLRLREPVFEFRSRAKTVDDKSGKEFQQKAYLLTRRQDIERALKTFSSSPYKPIGSGTFVLALDNGDGHVSKRQTLLHALKPNGTVSTATTQSEIHHVAALACQHALVAPLKNESFDLVTGIAEQAALRFVAAYFGIPDQYHLPLQDAMRKVYTGMIFQMFARHFVTDPQVLSEGNAALGTLARLVAGLAKEADSVPLAAKLTQVIALNPADARTLFDSIAKGAEEFASLRAEALEYRNKLSAPGLALRTARLFDRILDLAPVRAQIDDWILAQEGIDPTLQEAVMGLVLGLCARKQSRDEQLVPRAYALTAENRVGPASAATSPQQLFSRESIIERLARSPTAISGSEIAVTVVGTIAGLVGNVIAGACIAIDRFFQLDMAARAEIQGRAQLPDKAQSANSLLPFVNEALRLQPPAAFVPRMTQHDEVFEFNGAEIKVPRGSEIIVPLGAATRDLPPGDQPDEFRAERPRDAYLNLFGHPDEDPTSHRCVGEFIALPLIAHIVRSVLVLPGLAQIVVDGQPVGLKKKWGYICESFPLRYKRIEACVQEPLNVVMKIRNPSAEHAAALKFILQSAAPSIERLLAESGIVHFARFVFLNNDTELGLFTVYDGPFKPYIEHFASHAGPLFDKIFEHLQESSPLPVRNHPAEFVELIAKFNVPSAAGYFFSAHPDRKV